MPFDTAPKLGMTAINGNVFFESFVAEINRRVFMILPVIICDPLNNSGTQNARAKIVVSNVIIFFIEIDNAFADILNHFFMLQLILFTHINKLLNTFYYTFSF